MGVCAIGQSLAQSGIPIDRAIIIGSGILDKLGIRKSADIDVVVPKDEFDKLADNNNFLKGKKYDDDYYQSTNGQIEAWCYWWDFKRKMVISYETLAENSVLIDNLRFVSLAFLRQWKADCARVKDIEDVKLIDSYLESNRE